MEKKNLPLLISILVNLLLGLCILYPLVIKNSPEGKRPDIGQAVDYDTAIVHVRAFSTAYLDNKVFNNYMVAYDAKSLLEYYTAYRDMTDKNQNVLKDSGYVWQLGFYPMIKKIDTATNIDFYTVPTLCKLDNNKKIIDAVNFFDTSKITSGAATIAKPYSKDAIKPYNTGTLFP